MNICMFSHGNPYMNGNQSPVVARHVDYASSANGKVYLIYFDPTEEKLDTIRTLDGFTAINCGAKLKVFYPLSVLRIFLQLRRTVDFDLIYTQDAFVTGLLGLVVKLFFGVKLIVGSHASFLNNDYWIREKPFQNRLFNWISKVNFKYADGIKSVSFEEANRIRLLTNKSTNILVQNTPLRIPETVDAVSFESYGLCPNDRILISVGRLTPQKNHKALISIVSNLEPETYDKLVIVGNGSEHEIKALNKHAQTTGLGKKFVIIPNLEHATLCALYKLSYVYLHTALYEGVCKTILEAAAFSLPTVVFEISGLRQSILHDISGFIIPHGREDLFLEVLSGLLSDDKRRHEMGAAASEFVLREHSYDIMISRITNFWKEVCAE